MNMGLSGRSRLGSGKSKFKDADEACAWHIGGVARRPG